MIPDRARLAVLFEGAPRFLDRIMASAPFPGAAAMFATARAIAHAMPEDEQIELIDAHPRLGAAPATVSASSYVEQGYAGEAATAATAHAIATHRLIAAELDRLNAAYESRFGFRYCVFVAGRTREALLPGMIAALDADREAEIERALDAVVDIAIDRHAKLSATTPDAPS